MSVVVLSPGQGQIPADLPELVASADGDLLGAYRQRVGDGAVKDPLSSSAATQAALIAAGVTRGRRALALLGGRAASYGPVLAFAGHSLGELTSMTLAGRISGPAAVALAADRGDAFDVARGDGWDGVGMLALSGPTIRDELDGLLSSHPGVELTNDNAADQLVVAGPAEQLAELTSYAREHGLRAVRLETTGPSHSSFMAPAAPAFQRSLLHVDFTSGSAPVFSGATASPMSMPVDQLSVTLATTLRWRETLLALGDLGPTHILDAGPGAAMGRLARKTLPDIPTISLEDLESAVG